MFKTSHITSTSLTGAGDFLNPFTRGCLMRSWQVQDAKARFSEFLEASLTEGPQVVTKRGIEAAVLIRIEEWRRLEQVARPSLKDLLLADEPRADLSLSRRGVRRRRAPVAFE